MDTLPRGRSGDKILFPDGTYDDRPADGTIFIDGSNLGASYQWDGLLNEWVDHRGEIWDSTDFRKQETKSEKNDPVVRKPSLKVCGCGARALGVDKHAEYCDLYEKE